ncbi:hypothetical protein BDV24DRAFT_135985 [Aspergillus arachidicola]|uniref:Uncharacterized protein n=1 Tax=Aspergillus arachidicola TaxID=656916 RepID=A0A5N6Y1X2_9EURO|nr:hypothetical protein BDV24DRAFT_135985 [Aspergillus arachidicola]
MKRYHIRFDLPGDPWPEAHVKTFDNIQKLGKFHFDTYCAGVSIWSSSEPWKEQIKSRAQWLSRRTERLFGQERNEAGWRFELENDILMRFSAEVACPKCRARIWKSEIEATFSGNQTEHPEKLEERRKRRTPCQCPPNERFKDFYELGTNRLFDSRVQEFVVYDNLLRSQLPKQAPDRVIGLQCTRNFDNLLSSPICSDLANNEDDIVSDILQATPFQSQADPLLFPFLLLEAKSETSPSGFDAILVQSAFPIYTLLKLQEDLRSSVAWTPGGEGFEPLVWFLASRGDLWRVYACHLKRGANEEPTRYNITLLWSGSLIHKDGALQLLLIVDYIMDWARDIYRVAILKQIKSLVTGEGYDQISIVDSDVFSMRRDISNWIPAPPSTVLDDDSDQSSGIVTEEIPSSLSLEHQAMLNFQIPNSVLGSVRSAALSEFRFDCLYLTKELIPSFLEVIGGRWDNPQTIEKAARHIINFVIQFDEVLVMSGADLEFLERLWTNATRSDPEAQREEFYVVMECGWFFTPSWEITRQLSCFAISKAAFNSLRTHAKFSVRRRGIENLSKVERRCSKKVLQECVECLRAGSPWQVLLAAISCTLVTVYPLPARRRDDFTPPVDVLGLGYPRDDRVTPFIRKYLKRVLWKPRRKIVVSNKEMQAALRQGYTADEVFAMRRDESPRHGNMSWKRNSKQLTHIIEEECHTHDTCERCRRSLGTNLSPFGHGYLDTRNQPVLSAYGTVLVVSVCDISMSYKPEACVFALKSMGDLKDNMALSLMVEDLMQSKLVYHTTKCGVSDIKSNEGVKYNLPLPYRQIAQEDETLLMNWIRELRDEDHSSPQPSQEKVNNIQKVIYYLSLGHLEHEAQALVQQNYRFSTFNDMVSQVRQENWKHNYDQISPHRKVKLCGNDLTPRFTTWDDGKAFLRQHYPKQFEATSSLNTPQIPTREQGRIVIEIN